MTSATPSQSKKDMGWLFLSYLTFGLLHEAAHALVALSLGLSFGDSFHFADFVAKSFVGRACEIPGLDDAPEWQYLLVKHAGWIFSSLLALVVALSGSKVTAGLKSSCDNKSTLAFWSCVKQASLITAVEAISTDLLGIGLTSSKRSILFCGNFGVILLDPAWTNTAGDYGKTALDLLEKMIQVTMMRGAQTGGVVSWVTDRRTGDPKAIRSRVVNKKRTDLSKEIRKLLNKDLCRSGRINPTVRCMLGHTRFATTSKATMEGTHPHQWSPPRPRKVYQQDERKVMLSKSPKPIVRMESNFITHNGDLDFFKLNGEHYDLETIQKWLVKATGNPMPATVDSAAIAGLVDLIRTAGSFALSIRYVYVVLGASKSSMRDDAELPLYRDYEHLELYFEAGLREFCLANNTCLALIKEDKQMRFLLSKHIRSKIKRSANLSETAFSEFAYIEEMSTEINLLGVEDQSIKDGLSLITFVRYTVDAFFDNDLFTTTKLFLMNAVGSFGLMVTSSMDAHRQVCFAARGQPMCVAFHPEKALICYGSELAAVRAGMSYDIPGGKTFVIESPKDGSKIDIPQQTCRLDLDDLGGEIVLVDFSQKNADGSLKATIQTHQESKAAGSRLEDRVLPLESNELLCRLRADEPSDPVLDDIQSIPKCLDNIQKGWKEGGLNRMTSWTLGRCLKHRLQKRIDGKIVAHSGTVDILVTGCEVSLWLAEQFVADLNRAFPKLFIRAVSSNKLLGIFGQELAVPSVGFPMSDRSPDLRNSIVIIVSHSGGTFGPLAVSNLLQSVTENIFVVSSEWDTQIGKQLRKIGNDEHGIFCSRIFSTDIGVRPAEPCSLSVVATHQLLTQIFEYISLVVLSERKFRDLSGAVITKKDLEILERCNEDNILALERIVGVDSNGSARETTAQTELKEVGDLWADHVLENARAYIMSIIYILVTVTIGYPLVTGIVTAGGVGSDLDWVFYITRFFDAVIYILLPQINVIILRLIQSRTLNHRMVGRTVVIGDIPWVAQSAEAFLSKLFARSYSIAGVNVHSGNPSDHLVHRMTHRVTRGSLLVAGRPDGRLTALTSAECAVTLSVNQASSIQSYGGTCESITIGHNPYPLQLTKTDIFLGTSRPKFMCEALLDVVDSDLARKQDALKNKLRENGTELKQKGILVKILNLISSVCGGSLHSSDISLSDDGSSAGGSILNRSSHSLKGAYLGMMKKSSRNIVETEPPKSDEVEDDDEGVVQTEISHAFQQEQNAITQRVIEDLISENHSENELHSLFMEIDTDGSGELDLEEFVAAYGKLNKNVSRETIVTLFEEADLDDGGTLSFEEFRRAVNMTGVDVLRTLQQANLRDDRGILQVEPSKEEYFGADMRSSAASEANAFSQSQSQHFAMELYESRIASMQRFVSYTVLFHRMGKRVADFFPKYSLGMMSYDMSKSHSIMRIATTASPVSGDAVRDQMESLNVRARILHAANTITSAWRRSQERQLKKFQQKLKARQSPVANRKKLLASLGESSRSMHSTASVKSGLADSASSFGYDHENNAKEKVDGLDSIRRLNLNEEEIPESAVSKGKATSTVDKEVLEQSATDWSYAET